jgi:hypothetical protein
MKARKRLQVPFGFEEISHGGYAGGFSQGDNETYWVRWHDDGELLKYTINFQSDDAPTNNEVYVYLDEALTECNRMNKAEAAA